MNRSQQLRELLVWVAITACVILSMPDVQAVEVVIDKPVCDARGMMGMAALEAKSRGVKPETWKKQLEGLEAKADPKSSFYHGLKFGEGDYRDVYAYGRTQYREVTYVDLYSSCMAMLGQKVKLPLQ